MFKVHYWVGLACLTQLGILSVINGLNETLFKSATISWNDDDDNINCDELLESFALASSNFTFCAIHFARPIRLCQFCVGKYIVVESRHHDILTLEDEETGKTCKDILINFDRLQVVQSAFDYAAGLWNRALCNNCYEVDDEGNPTKELNQNTKEILRLSNLTHRCINEHKNDTTSELTDPLVCDECKRFYSDLNSRYDSLKKYGFCMDIVDMMNLTRALWSTELGCCLERKQPEWLFLVSSLVFTCLPLVFYLAAFMLVTRKEQIVHRQRRLQGNVSTTASTSNMMLPD